MLCTYFCAIYKKILCQEDASNSIINSFIRKHPSFMNFNTLTIFIINRLKQTNLCMSDKKPEMKYKICDPFPLPMPKKFL